MITFVSELFNLGAFISEEVKVDTGDVKPLNSSLSDCVNSVAMAIPDIESIEEDCATGDPELLENLEFVASEIEATEQKAEEVTSEVNVESESSNDSEKIKDQCFPSDDDENLFEKPTVWDDPANHCLVVILTYPTKLPQPLLRIL